MGRDAWILKAFPNIGTFAITSGDTPSYNCIAWAFGDNTRWWWPHPFAFWPLPLTNSGLTRDFEELFDFIGAIPTNSLDFDADYLKIALFAKNGEPSHAARLLPSGKWTSKLGKEDDIAHDLYAIEGIQYGKVLQVFKIKEPDSAPSGP